MNQQGVCEEPQVQEEATVNAAYQMDLSAGIIIIGSLYWDQDESRAHWRESRLRMDDEYTVCAPIRYGRRSASRGNTYTMVFSRSCLEIEGGLGQAKVVRCKNPIRSSQDLVNEAEWLWAAEQKELQSDGTISAGWGCVGLLMNPQSAVPDEFRDAWARRVSQRSEPRYGRLSHTAIYERAPLVVGWSA